MFVVKKIPPRLEFFALLHHSGNGNVFFARVVNLEPFSFGHRRVFCLFWAADFGRFLHPGDVGFKFVLPDHVRYLAIGAGHLCVASWALWTFGLPLLGLLSSEIFVINFLFSGQYFDHI